MRVADRVVVVTGGGSGIGAAMALRLAAQGVRAEVVADRDAAATGQAAASAAQVRR